MQTRPSSLCAHSPAFPSLHAPPNPLSLPQAIGGLVRRFPRLRLAVPPESLRYTAPQRDVGLEALPVKWW
jgi:hypothetical protein